MADRDSGAPAPPTSVSKPKVELPPDDISHTINVPAMKELKWKECVRRIKLGQTTAQIAKAMDMSVLTIREWFSDARFITLARREDIRIFADTDADIGDLQSAIQGAAPQAFEELMVILEESPDPKVRAQVAQDLLDRAGHSAVKKSVKASIELGVTRDGAKALLDAYRESLDVEKGQAPSDGVTNLGGEVDVSAVPGAPSGDVTAPGEDGSPQPDGRDDPPKPPDADPPWVPPSGDGE